MLVVMDTVHIQLDTPSEREHDPQFVWLPLAYHCLLIYHCCHDNSIVAHLATRPSNNDITDYTIQ